MFIGNDAPIGRFTLRAECDFGRAGKIILVEHFSNEANGYTFDSNSSTNSAANNASERNTAANATRYLEVKVVGMNTLCPRSSYTLTFHQFNNVGCMCKNVGPLLAGSATIVSESIAVNA